LRALTAAAGRVQSSTTAFDLNKRQAITVAKDQINLAALGTEIGREKFQSRPLQMFFCRASPSSPRRRCSGFSLPVSRSFNFPAGSFVEINPLTRRSAPPSPAWAGEGCSVEPWLDSIRPQAERYSFLPLPAKRGEGRGEGTFCIHPVFKKFALGWFQRREAAPMDRTRTVRCNRRQMLRRAVAFMLGKPDFGHCRSNSSISRSRVTLASTLAAAMITPRIALHNGRVWHRHGLDRPAIHERVFGRGLQLRERVVHGAMRGAQNIDGVNLSGPNLRDGKLHFGDTR